MIRLTIRSILVLAGGCLLPLGSAVAQCPDGTPPPCRGAAAPATRRPVPPLDDKTWIVVPFENVARVQDIDWLKDASVNLLYLDMSKWTDIHVIDDERVADLIREVPEARRGAQLTLQSGMAVAKRAGAGRLVMGDLLKVGTRTQIVGKVFDVRTGQRLRTVRQEAANPDSIMASFGVLARGVLNLGAPSSGSAGGIGTTSIGAYQSYIAGVAFLNRWILDSARVQFAQALALDSTFALAHYKLALVYGWDAPGSAEGPRHAGLAAQLGTGLPARERALVSGYAAFSNHHYAEACGIFGRMVRADSTDVEGWYNLGECSYHDPAVVPAGGDSTRMVFQGDWNTMLRAFRKTLDLDPTYHLAFQHIQDALLVSSRTGCRLRGEETQCVGQNPELYQAFLLRDADSLVIAPVKVSRDPEAYAAQGLKWGSQHARAANLEEARRAAESWLQAGPNESRPKAAYARILLRMGNPQGARAMLHQIPPNAFHSRVEVSNLWVDRIESAIKLDSIAEATMLADSLRTLTDTIPGLILGDVVWSVFGHRKPLAAAITKTVDGPAWVGRYFRLQADAVLGLTSDSLFDAEAAFAKNLTPSQGVTRVAQLITGTVIWVDPKVRGRRWPVTDTSSSDPRLRLLSVLASGDTAAFRRALLRFDSLAVLVQDGADNGFALTGAYGHLAVADTVGALRLLRNFQSTTWPKTPILDNLGAGFTFSGMLWARTFLLLGDLETATGQPPAALAAYRRFVRLWQGADPEFQPDVARARAAISSLGG
jgi:TolB-like protein